MEATVGVTCGTVRNGRFATSGRTTIAALQHIGTALDDFASWTPACDPNKHWRLSDASIVADAKKYKTRNEWKQASGTYNHVHQKRPHLLPACTAHMGLPDGPILRGYQVYCYEFEDNTAYVGLTCVPHKRHVAHTKAGPVAAKIKAGVSHRLCIISDRLPASAAAALEPVIIGLWQNIGWRMLNTQRGGSLGMSRFTHTFERSLAAARRCETRKDFATRFYREYFFACKHKWIGRIVADRGWPKHALARWSYETCLSSARRFKLMIEWVEGDKLAYGAAFDRGWLAKIRSECFGPQRVYSRKPAKWTTESCQARAQMFKSRADWQVNCHDGSWTTARRKGWLPEIGKAVFGTPLSLQRMSPDEAEAAKARKRRLRKERDARNHLVIA